MNKTLSRTEKIYTHGLHLISTVDPTTLDQQVCSTVGVIDVAAVQETQWVLSLPYRGVKCPNFFLEVHYQSSRNVYLISNDPQQ